MALFVAYFMLLPLSDKTVQQKSANEISNICTNNHNIATIDNYNDINITFNEKTPILFKVNNPLSLIDFKRALMDKEFSWTKNGDSNTPIGIIKGNDFFNEMSFYNTDKYIFDINTEQNDKVKCITNLIPCPDLYFLDKNRPNVSIYMGCKNTGTSLHTHHAAINYLISGKKLWIIFPCIDHNFKYCIENDIKNKCISISWLHLNTKKLKQNLRQLFIFTQKSGEIVYIPKNYYHATINLENSYGFAYSGAIL
jgi:hypothetical protein